jgi:hypothetical protein
MGPDYTPGLEAVEGTQTRRDPPGEALSDGRAFVADTGTISPGTSEFFAATIENPYAATAVVVYYVVVDNGGTDTVTPDLLQNPDTNAPSTAAATHTMAFGSGASTNVAVDAQAQADEMTAGTGTDTGLDFTIPSGFDQFPYQTLLQPGETLGISGSGGLAGASLNLSLWFYEVDAA